MLGFSKPAIEKTLDKLFKEKPDYTVEELIKKALKLL
jgi:Holliday junction resolvasome RuvABC DNA-binding subunit